MVTTTDYEQQAQTFLERFALKLTVKFADPQHCPKWGHERGCIHGDEYRVTLRRQGISANMSPASFRCSFWNSMNDMQQGKKPTAYDVLSSLSSEAHMPTTADEVADELGPMPPSQAIAAASAARRLQAFFTSDELDALAEIN